VPIEERGPVRNHGKAHLGIARELEDRTYPRLAGLPGIQACVAGVRVPCEGAQELRTR